MRACSDISTIPILTEPIAALATDRMEGKKANLRAGSTPDLSRYSAAGYSPGAGPFARAAWFLFSALLFETKLFPFYAPKRLVLRLFGARVGKGLVIKPRVRIKYPWRLIIGRNCWLGEDVWIDNLERVSIGDNVCVSQGAYLLTGNHNFKRETFDLITAPIYVGDGAWIGAKAVVSPGVVIHRNAVITLGAVMTSNADEEGIYRGNPAQLIRIRKIEVVSK